MVKISHNKTNTNYVYVTYIEKCQSDWLTPAAQSLPPPSRDINPGLDPGGSVVAGDGP